MQQEQLQEPVSIPKRVLSALLSSVSAGVVPRIGAPYIAIGRTDEIAALCRDLDITAEGGAGMRFIIGPYGSGKSFLLQLMRGYAIDRGFITADADLSPERKICGTKGQGIATYQELIRNMASKAAPQGGALPGIIGKWFSALQTEIAAGGTMPGTEAFSKALSARVFGVAKALENEIGGFDFASVLIQYYQAYLQGDEDCKSACMRWLRGEFATKTEAKGILSVGGIIDDGNWYEYVKLMSVFLQEIGYCGLVVILDECVNLYKISNRISRENNYEKLLAMFNDTLQGKAQGLMMILGGTPQFLEDRRRGLFSYEALRSRLCDGQFDSAVFKNYIGPVIRLRRLSDAELLALVARITRLHSRYYDWEARITEEDMIAFVQYCLTRAGADTMITPREIIRDWCGVLNILLQNETVDFQAVMAGSAVTLRHDDAPGEDDETEGEAANKSGGSDALPNKTAEEPAHRQGGDSPSDFDLNDIEI